VHASPQLERLADQHPDAQAAGLLVLDGQQRALVKLSESAEGPALLGRVVKSLL
jgi:hypothetical protein